MRNRNVQWVAIVAAGALLTISCKADFELATIRVATGLSRPVYVTAPPGDTSRLFILEQHTGMIKILNLADNTVNATPFLDIDGLATGNEQGLLGLAFHPDYANNGYFYVDITVVGRTTHIRRYQVSGDPNVADPGSATTVLTIAQPETNHNGGWIAFGADNYLYIAMGDGGGGNDQHGTIGNAQDITDNLLGKMLRIDVDGDDFPADPDRNYAIPPSNPFVGVTGDDEIWAYGLRNPWRNSFDRATNDLYIADVGQNVVEEINFQPASSMGSENYGWRCMEGDRCTGLTGCTCNDAGLVLPIHVYTHGGSPFRCSITGGYVYRGPAMTCLQGTYFFADYCSNQVWSFRYDGANMTEFMERTAEIVPDQGSIGSITSFGEDARGELYICDQGGEIFKLVPRTALGDMNCDGAVDGADIDAFFLALAFPDDYANQYPACCSSLGDLNGDASFDGGDIDPFFQCVGGFGCP